MTILSSHLVCDWNLHFGGQWWVVFCVCFFFERLIVFFKTSLWSTWCRCECFFFFVFKSSKRTTCCEYLIRFRVKKEALNCNTCLNQKSNWSNFLKTSSPMRELLNEHTLTFQQVVTFTIDDKHSARQTIERTNMHPLDSTTTGGYSMAIFQWCQILPQHHQVFKCQIYMFFPPHVGVFQWSFMRT